MLSALDFSIFKGVTFPHPYRNFEEVMPMSFISRCSKTALVASLAILAATFQTGCSTIEGNVALIAAGVTVLGAQSPGQEIQQIYYLGVFDPQEQVPPMVYRVRVHGQASVLSGMKFGSGWVPASVIDSLGSNITFKEGNISVDKAGSDTLSSIRTGRRLVLFGPEGFREAPKDHRLVIVMGASPEKYFNAVDQSLGVVSRTIAEQRNEGLTKLLLAALSDAKNEQIRLDDLAKDVENDLRGTEGGVQ